MAAAPPLTPHDPEVGQAITGRPGASAALVGWLAAPGPPFAEPLVVPYTGRSLVLIGPNGYGKTRLLRAVTDRGTPRIYTRLPRRLAPYLELARLEARTSSRGLSRLTDSELFAAAEQCAAFDADEDWWRQRAGVRQPRWLVEFKGRGVPGRVRGVDAEDLAREYLAFPAASGHLDPVVERWVTPEAEALETLSRLTLEHFRRWSEMVSVASGDRLVVYRNPLVARARDGRSVSLLPLATTFAGFAAERSAARLRRLAGFDLELRCIPEDDFAWEFRSAGTWIAITNASRAVGRWTALATTETLRELTRAAADASDLEVAASADVADGEIPSSCRPPAPPGAFATRSSWVALDEPEVHLFASEAHTLARTLAEHAAEGRLLTATHSLELAARLVGDCDFVTFSAPGRLEVAPPQEELRPLLGRLAVHGPGILAETRVLYVEGAWDIELIRRLHGSELDSRNVILSSMNGVLGANLAASSVWHRLIPTPFGMMFDALNAAEVGRQRDALVEVVATRGRHEALRRLRAQIRQAGRMPNEDKALLRLFESVLENRLETRLRLVMHGLSDILQVLHPSVFGLTADTWTEAGYDERTSFKDFVRGSAGVDLGQGDQCRRMVNRFDQTDRPVDAAAAAALADALRAFVHEDRFED